MEQKLPRYQSDPMKVFLCHSSGDKIAVRKLYRRLRRDGYQPWLDEEALLPGQNWDLEITRAVRSSAVVLVCLSQGAVNKAGYLQKEIKYVLDVADEQPEGAIFTIPVRLEECDLPERLRQLQWVNLFDEQGYGRLRKALASKGLVTQSQRPAKSEVGRRVRKAVVSPGHLEEKGDTVFLYSHLLESIKTKLAMGAINLAGGMFTGKSSFLEQFAGYLRRMGREVMLVKGKGPDRLRLPLSKVRVDHSDVEFILIDDLDRLLLPDQEPSSQSGEELAQLHDTIDTILELAKVTESDGADRERKVKLLVTTTGRFFNFLNPSPSLQQVLLSLPKDLVVAYSRLDGRLDLVQLNPWEGDWRTRWDNLFEREFENEMTLAGQLVAWSNPITDITGGHPALFGPVVEKLRTALKECREKPTALPNVDGGLFVSQNARGHVVGGTVRWERLIRAKIEEWIEGDGVHPLGRILRRLRDSDNALEQDAFRELVRIAGAENAEPPEDKCVRDLLRFEYALAYEDKETGNYLVPGAYLRTIIRGASYGVQVVQVQAETDPQVEHRGIVRIQTAGGEKAIRLGLGKWRVFQILFKRRGELVTLREIEEETHMTKRAVQKVVTRLRQKQLREVGLAIVNERDRGYRLIVPSSRS